MSFAIALNAPRRHAITADGNAHPPTLEPTVGTPEPSTRESRGRLLPDSRERRIALALARKDPRGLEDLHALTARASYAVILGIVRDRGDAEDVQQRVYAELWRRAGQYDPGRGSLLTWVLTIARSRAVDQIRRRKDQPIDSDALIALGGSSLDRAYDDLVDRALVGEALARLPAQERDVLKMRFWGGLSQSEIADQTEIPLGTIKSRMTSGLRRLRSELELEEVGE